MVNKIIKESIVKSLKKRGLEIDEYSQEEFKLELKAISLNNFMCSEFSLIDLKFCVDVDNQCIALKYIKYQSFIPCSGVFNIGDYVFSHDINVSEIE